METKLSDFTEDQLKTILKLILKDREHLKVHVIGLTAYPTMAHLLRTEIREYETEIEGLDLLATQFLGAVVSKEREAQIASN